MRLRLVFEKGDEVRFISHLDTMRTFVRAMRRGGIPVEYSQGFNPHPKMAFALPLAVGVTSSAEVVDIDLRERLDPGEVVERLNRSFPAGIRIVSAREIGDGMPSAMSEVWASEYETDAAVIDDGMDPERAVNRFMESASFLVTRREEGGNGKARDIRPLVLRLSGSPCSDRACFGMLVRSGSEANARPDEVLRAIDLAGGGWLDLAGAKIHRKALYRMAGVEMKPLA